MNISSFGAIGSTCMATATTKRRHLPMSWQISLALPGKRLDATRSL